MPSDQNIQADPRFRDAVNGNLRLRYCSPCNSCSPCFDLGYDALIDTDSTDVDDDGDPGEVVPVDAKRGPRVVDLVDESDPLGRGDVDMGAYEECFADIDGDGSVGLSDLTLLLSCFGTATCDSGCCNADIHDCDADVDLSDLSSLLSRFGAQCSTSFTVSSGSVDLSVQAFDTGGYTGSNFAGEVHHFVFDVVITVNTSADDWTASGVQATVANGATFLLVPGATNPPTPGSGTTQKYTTFFSKPYPIDSSSRFEDPLANGAIAGRYTGSGGYVYTNSDINCGWYVVIGTSNDGPAAVLRVVFNVKSVNGANTSGGFGSVYFTTGAGGSGDIKIADMTIDIDHKYDDSGSTIVTGAFYVTD